MLKNTEVYGSHLQVRVNLFLNADEVAVFFKIGNAPAKAPIVVAISKNIPSRMFVMPSFTYAAAEPDDVAITDTNEAPIA